MTHLVRKSVARDGWCYGMASQSESCRDRHVKEERSNLLSLYGMCAFRGYSLYFQVLAISGSVLPAQSVACGLTVDRLTGTVPPANIPLPHRLPSEHTQNSLSSIMSSSTSLSATTPSNFQLLVNALGDYLDQTGIDLSQNPLAEKIQLSNTPNAILEILEEREKAFKEYRDSNRRLISCLSPAVRVLHAFSATLGEAIGLVSVISLVPLYLFNPALAVPILPGKGYHNWN